MNTENRATRTRRARSQAGNVMLEFALVSIVFVPLLIGVVAVGLNLGRSAQVAQIARDSASMFVRGIDFSLSGNKDLLVQLARPMSMSASGGNGVVVFSKVAYIPPSACAGIPTCNSGQTVLVQRVSVGNQALRQSNIRTAGNVVMDSQGNVDNYLTDPAAVVTGVAAALSLGGGEFAYVAEAYFPSLDIATFTNGTGVYSIAVF